MNDRPTDRTLDKTTFTSLKISAPSILYTTTAGGQNTEQNIDRANAMLLLKTFVDALPVVNISDR